MDPSKATGFGDLTVHEFATDATENLAYSSYYAGGMRAFSFGDNGLEPIGKYIDRPATISGASRQFTTANGERLIAGSDRNVGLYLFRYTGPGAPARPVCSSASATTPVGAAVAIPLSCTDANGNPLTLRVGGPAGPRHGRRERDDRDVHAGRRRVGRRHVHVRGERRRGGLRPGDRDGGAAAAPARCRRGSKAGPCANDLLGTAARETLTGTSAGDRILGRAGQRRHSRQRGRRLHPGRGRQRPAGRRRGQR